MDPKAKKTRLPRDLDRWSDEEIAQFFEENDPLEFLDETEPVEVETISSSSSMVQVNFRLPENALNAIKNLSKRLTIGHTTLIRLWVMERLYERLAEEAQSKSR
ncbi:MAG: CopG family antitoxin [Candidatus Bipolaricaulia bacterium]